MKLVIVESPTKVKSIQAYLGKEYKVMASYGNFRDLATSGPESLGVDIKENFKPDYVVDPKKEKIIAKLKEAVEKADEVFLATDPDREGEAISWHLAETLDLDLEKTRRLEFHEITKRSVVEALDHPRPIDMQLVQSQETRRIIDRIMGFRLSKLVQQKVNTPSAGRVQSVALKVIVDLEKEIAKFVPQSFNTLTLNVSNESESWEAKLVHYQGQKIRQTEIIKDTIYQQTDGETTPTSEHLLTDNELQGIISSIGPTIEIVDVKNEKKLNHSPSVFKTATLQQEAFRKLRFSPNKTMKIAQQLFEGVTINKKTIGLITYMRTDSDRVNGLFVKNTKDFIRDKFGDEYVGNAKSFAKDGQNAHEGVRPTDVTLIPNKIKDSLSKEEFELYRLIWERAVASIMAPRQFMLGIATLKQGDSEFEIRSEETLFDGYQRLYETNQVSGNGEGLKLTPGMSLKVEKVTPQSHSTKPPYRFTEGSLISFLDREQIGRPSTFATIVNKVKDRNYVELKGNYLVPTQVGQVAAETLVRYFPEFINVPYTSKMEENLDKVSEGINSRLNVLNGFYEEFSQSFEKAVSAEPVKVMVETNDKCPDCGGKLIYKIGKYGEYIACENYPKTCQFHKAKPKPVPDKIYPCPKCKDGHLVIRKGKYGPFKGCSNYPKCDYISNFKSFKKKES